MCPARPVLVRTVRPALIILVYLVPIRTPVKALRFKLLLRANWHICAFPPNMRLA
jgi:hypothetical protein